MEKNVFTLLLTGFSKSLIYHLALLAVVSCYWLVKLRPSDVLPSIMGWVWCFLLLVSPITCQVFFERACPFFLKVSSIACSDCSIKQTIWFIRLAWTNHGLIKNSNACFQIVQTLSLKLSPKGRLPLTPVELSIKAKFYILGTGRLKALIFHQSSCMKNKGNKIHL